MLVGICGGPCSGKTVLTRALVNKLCMKGYNAEYVNEYARFYINQCNHEGSEFVRTPLHQAIILRGQLEWENIVPKTVEFVVSDSPVLAHMCYTYNLVDFYDHSHVEFYHQYYRDMMQYRLRYSPLFYLPPTIDFKSDGTRAQNPERAVRIGEQIKAFLVFHQVPFVEITSTDLEKRVEFCVERLIDS